MGNPLDEVNGPVFDSGNDVRVRNQRIPVKIGFFTILFEIFIWAIGFLVAAVVSIESWDQMDNIYIKIAIWVLAFVPGVCFTIAKIKAKNYFLQLSQRIQHLSSQIENYQEQRSVILMNLVSLLEKSINLDKDVMTAVAAYRSGAGNGDLNQNAEALNRGFASLVPHLEAYPELKSQFNIAEAMRQNERFQREITAARDLYNQTVEIWNVEIFSWPIKQIVAARNHYTTMMPFSASTAVIEQSRSNFFA